jgi:type II secretory ATPase GspE/PulE/Tfp pilus assembly ATPase PilB-like protein
MAERLGDILLRAGLMDQEDLEAALAHQVEHGGRLGEILADMGAVSYLEITRALATQLGIPSLGPEQLAVDDEALRALTLDFCTDQLVAPVRRPDTTLRLAMAEPLDDQLYERALAAVPGLTGRAVALGADILAALASRLGRAEALETLSRSLPGVASVEILGDCRRTYDFQEDEAVVRVAARRILEQIIGNALSLGADELIVDPRPAGVLLRYRIEGRLRDGLLLPSHAHPALLAALAEAAGIGDPLGVSPRGHIRAVSLDRSVDLQVTVARTGRGVRTVLKLMPAEEPIQGLDDIGVPTQAQDFLYQALSSEGAAILVTGMLSRGRRQTMRACLSWISVDECNVVAVEDSFSLGGLPGVARLDAGLDPSGLAGTLRAALQQDPDVLVVSQIRDRESAEVALEAALDGRTVICGLPATNTLEALRRILDMGVNRRLLAHALSLVLSHHSLRRVCDGCRAETQPSAMSMAELGRTLGREARGPFYAGTGCDQCLNSGVTGTVSVYGALRSDARVRIAITRGLNGDELRAAMTPYVFVSSADAALEQAHGGFTTAEELALHLQSTES